MRVAEDWFGFIDRTWKDLETPAATPEPLDSRR